MGCSLVLSRGSSRVPEALTSRREVFSPSPGFLEKARFLRVKTSRAGAAEMDRFQLSPSSVVRIIKGDITEWSADGSSDAIVSLA